MTDESARVVTSPTSRCSATSRSSRLMILPERVLGSSATTRMVRGFASVPICLRTCSRNADATSSPSAGMPSASERTITKDRQVAYTALFARTVESERVRVSSADVVALEHAVVAAHFHGSYSAYRAALAKAGANVSLARGILADELRQVRNILATGSKDGMQTLDQCLKELVRKNVVTAAEARTKAENKLDFAS